MWAYEWWKGQFWGGFQPQTAKKRWGNGDSRCEAGDGSCNPPCKGWLLGLCLCNVSLGHSALKALAGRGASQLCVAVVSLHLWWGWEAPRKWQVGADSLLSSLSHVGTTARCELRDIIHPVGTVEVAFVSLCGSRSSFLPQAEGYADGDTTLYHRFTLMDFLKAPNPVDFLSKANEVSACSDGDLAGP